MKLNFLRRLKGKIPFGLFFLLPFLVMLAISLFSLYFFIELGEEISEKSFLVDIDNYILNLIKPGKYPSIEKAMVIISNFASWQGILIISIVVLLFLLYRKIYFLAIALFLVTGGSITTNVILKNIFNRPRPEGKHIVKVISSSFPSGHSMVGFAVYSFMIYLVWKLIKSLPIKIASSLLLLLLIFLIGFSRVYLRVHYPSDVIGGFTAGLFWLLLCLSMVNISKYFLNREN